MIHFGDGSAAGGLGGNVSYDALITHLMNQYQPQTVATSQAARAALPRRLVPARDADGAAHVVAAGKEDGGEQQQSVKFASCRCGDPCSVCQDEFKEGAEVVELPCSHCYHETCIMPWLETVKAHHPKNPDP